LLLKPTEDDDDDDEREQMESDGERMTDSATVDLVRS
jgi:hypothetical protein